MVKDVKKGRVVVDLKPLNRVAILNSYSLSLQQEIINAIRGKKYFIVIDITNFFFQLIVCQGKSWVWILYVRKDGWLGWEAAGRPGSRSAGGARSRAGACVLAPAPGARTNGACPSSANLLSVGLIVQILLGAARVGLHPPITATLLSNTVKQLILLKSWKLKDLNITEDENEDYTS